MERKTLMDKYPVTLVRLGRDETLHGSFDALVDYFTTKVEEHPKAKLIAVFDHYAHTKAINGEVADTILGAKNVVFCFGLMLPGCEVMAVRPRSIAIVETLDGFEVSFMDAPNEVAHNTMEEWVAGIRKA